MTKTVTRIAITYQPRAIVVEFKKSEHENSIFHKKVTFRKIDERMDHETLARLLMKKYPDLFETVPRNRIEMIMKRLLHRNDDASAFALNPEDGSERDLNKVSDEELAQVKNTMDEVYDLNKKDGSERDLNKVSDEELAQVKNTMDEVYDLNKIPPNDTCYEYDRRVDYYPESDSSWD